MHFRVWFTLQGYLGFCKKPETSCNCTALPRGEDPCGLALYHDAVSNCDSHYYINHKAFVVYIILHLYTSLCGYVVLFMFLWICGYVYVVFCGSYIFVVKASYNRLLNSTCIDSELCRMLHQLF